MKKNKFRKILITSGSVLATASGALLSAGCTDPETKALKREIQNQTQNLNKSISNLESAIKQKNIDKIKQAQEILSKFSNEAKEFVEKIKNNSKLIKEINKFEQLIEKSNKLLAKSNSEIILLEENEKNIEKTNKEIEEFISDANTKLNQIDNQITSNDIDTITQILNTISNLEKHLDNQKNKASDFQLQEKSVKLENLSDLIKLRKDKATNKLEILLKDKAKLDEIRSQFVLQNKLLQDELTKNIALTNQNDIELLKKSNISLNDAIKNIETFRNKYLNIFALKSENDLLQKLILDAKLQYQKAKDKLVLLQKLADANNKIEKAKEKLNKILQDLSKAINSKNKTEIKNLILIAKQTQIDIENLINFLENQTLILNLDYLKNQNQLLILKISEAQELILKIDQENQELKDLENTIEKLIADLIQKDNRLDALIKTTKVNEMFTALKELEEIYSQANSIYETIKDNPKLLEIGNKLLVALNKIKISINTKSIIINSKIEANSIKQEWVTIRKLIIKEVVLIDELIAKKTSDDLLQAKTKTNLLLSKVAAVLTRAKVKNIVDIIAEIEAKRTELSALLSNIEKSIQELDVKNKELQAQQKELETITTTLNLAINDLADSIIAKNKESVILNKSKLADILENAKKLLDKVKNIELEKFKSVLSKSIALAIKKLNDAEALIQELTLITSEIKNELLDFTTKINEFISKKEYETENIEALEIFIQTVENKLIKFSDLETKLTKNNLTKELKEYQALKTTIDNLLQNSKSKLIELKTKEITAIKLSISELKENIDKLIETKEQISKTEEINKILEFEANVNTQKAKLLPLNEKATKYKLFKELDILKSFNEQIDLLINLIKEAKNRIDAQILELETQTNALIIQIQSQLDLIKSNANNIDTNALAKFQVNLIDYLKKATKLLQQLKLKKLANLAANLEKVINDIKQAQSALEIQINDINKKIKESNNLNNLISEKYIALKDLVIKVQQFINQNNKVVAAKTNDLLLAKINELTQEIPTLTNSITNLAKYNSKLAETLQLLKSELEAAKTKQNEYINEIAKLEIKLQISFKIEQIKNQLLKEYSKLTNIDSIEDNEQLQNIKTNIETQKTELNKQNDLAIANEFADLIKLISEYNKKAIEEIAKIDTQIQINNHRKEALAKFKPVFDALVKATNDIKSAKESTDFSNAENLISEFDKKIVDARVLVTEFSNQPNLETLYTKLTTEIENSIKIKNEYEKLYIQDLKNKTEAKKTKIQKTTEQLKLATTELTNASLAENFDNFKNKVSVLNDLIEPAKEIIKTFTENELLDLINALKSEIEKSKKLIISSNERINKIVDFKRDYAAKVKFIIDYFVAKTKDLQNKTDVEEPRTLSSEHWSNIPLYNELKTDKFVQNECEIYLFLQNLKNDMKSWNGSAFSLDPISSLNLVLGFTITNLPKLNSFFNSNINTLAFSELVKEFEKIKLSNDFSEMTKSFNKFAKANQTQFIWFNNFITELNAAISWFDSEFKKIQPRIDQKFNEMIFKKKYIVNEREYQFDNFQSTLTKIKELALESAESISKANNLLNQILTEAKQATKNTELISQELVQTWTQNIKELETLKLTINKANIFISFIEHFRNKTKEANYLVKNEITPEGAIMQATQAFINLLNELETKIELALKNEFSNKIAQNIKPVLVFVKENKELLVFAANKTKLYKQFEKEFDTIYENYSSFIADKQNWKISENDKTLISKAIDASKSIDKETLKLLFENNSIENIEELNEVVKNFWDVFIKQKIDEQEFNSPKKASKDGRINYIRSVNEKNVPGQGYAISLNGISLTFSNEKWVLPENTNLNVQNGNFTLILIPLEGKLPEEYKIDFPEIGKAKILSVSILVELGKTRQRDGVPIKGSWHFKVDYQKIKTA
ncbi:hypothetical protein [Metamycoplasma equirhinis]|uniref:hypothetical protein n=3 Tax=Metamycoplasma equirhinis TaxID=92402 RepID=UPI003594363D